MRVSLTDIELAERQAAAARLRGDDWRASLDPARDMRDGEPTAPPMRERYAALERAVELERAALHPSPRGYLLPEEAVKKVLERGC